MASRPSRKIIGLLLVIAGLLVCIVPLLRMEMQRWTTASSRSDYLSMLEQEKPAQRADLLQRATAYNESLDQTGEDVRDPFGPGDDETSNALVKPNQVFAHLEIPKIKVREPVYLGATADHLSMGTGQVEGTSLPIGGVGTRSVIGGHNGWSSKEHFLFLSRLKPGDKIYLAVLGQLLTYEVHDSEVITPEQWDKLAAIPDQDTLTLLTCTPAPVNDHRLLVNARRIATPATDTVAQLRSALDKASAGSVDARVQAWVWITRIGLALLLLALGWTVLRLLRALRRRPDGESKVDEPVEVAES